MKYEEDLCEICNLEKEKCIYNNPVVKVVKSSEEDTWIVALHRHSALPLTSEIKCLKNAVKKIFHQDAQIDKFPRTSYNLLGSYTHIHWIVKGKPRFRA